MQKRESLIQLQRTEPIGKENQTKGEIHKMVFEENGRNLKEKVEPMLIQMPCTLPFEFNNKLNLNQLSQIGKIRFMKSGKVILRI